MPIASLALALSLSTLALPSVRLALAFDPQLPAAVRQVALEEAAAIWRPYGVAVLAAGADGSACGDPGVAVAGRLTVVVSGDTAGIKAWAAPFAAISFPPGGRPGDAIELRYAVLRRLGLGSVEIGGVRESRWPLALRDRILGRMTGRVVAHEIGHWTLRTREHSPSGLMRAMHTVGDLADVSRAPFELTTADVARLREVVGR